MVCAACKSATTSAQELGRMGYVLVRTEKRDGQTVSVYARPDADGFDGPCDGAFFSHPRWWERLMDVFFPTPQEIG